ncbi:hypothetical protein GCM10017559_63170 [Streptosporangium longisporum]|uniref:Uncharacterized protein n=1 Tax=Streptosporangium longisporum TaxID=46187 RepID=A0ABP6L432_9ACTN
MIEGRAAAWAGGVTPAASTAKAMRAARDFRKRSLQEIGETPAISMNVHIFGRSLYTFDITLGLACDTAPAAFDRPSGTGSASGSPSRRRRPTRPVRPLPEGGTRPASFVPGRRSGAPEGPRWHVAGGQDRVVPDEQAGPRATGGADPGLPERAPDREPL